MKDDLAVCLISGGLDSCVCATIASRNHKEVVGVHFNYAQKTNERELQAFYKICDHLGIKKRFVIDLSFFKEIGGSALTSNDIPIPLSTESTRTDEIPVTYVPFRNGVFLSIATAICEALGGSSIYIGANQVDFSGYPDCRQVFFKAFNEAIKLGTKPQSGISIITPLINLSKASIIKEGLSIGAPLHLTWSCYQNTTKACGLCDSCRLRIKGFMDSGIADPIDYEIHINWIQNG